MVNKSFDRERVSQLNMTYVCPSKVNATSGQTNYTCSAELTILDVDDNGPWFQEKARLFKYQEKRVLLYELKRVRYNLKNAFCRNSIQGTMGGDVTPSLGRTEKKFVNQFLNDLYLGKKAKIFILTPKISDDLFYFFSHRIDSISSLFCLSLLSKI